MFAHSDRIKVQSPILESSCFPLAYSKNQGIPWLKSHLWNLLKETQVFCKVLRHELNFVNSSCLSQSLRDFLLWVLLFSRLQNIKIIQGNNLAKMSVNSFYCRLFDRYKKYFCYMVWSFEDIQEFILLLEFSKYLVCSRKKQTRRPSVNANIIFLCEIIHIFKAL